MTGIRLALQAGDKPIQQLETESGVRYFIGTEEDVRDLLLHLPKRKEQS